MTSKSEFGSIAGSNVLIVGGTSGIGLATAQQSTALGAHVTISGSDAQRAEAAASQNGFVGWRAFDVTRPAEVYAALADVPRVDHLVLLAGTFIVGRVLDADVEHLQRAFDERVWAAVHAIRALRDRLASDGSVTLVSGALSERPTSGTAILGAASAAMMHCLAGWP